MFLNSRLTVSEMASAMEDTRARTIDLVSDLETEQLLVPLLDIVNPFLWELGHIAFFYDCFLLRLLGGTESFIEGAADIYDSFTVEHGNRWRLELPDRNRTMDYLRRTLEMAVELLGSRDPGSGVQVWRYSSWSKRLSSSASSHKLRGKKGLS